MTAQYFLSVDGGRSERVVPLPSVAVIIPAYRAAGTIREVLTGIPAFVRSIVVVDDCSPDDPGTVARMVEDERIHVLKHEHNQGVGGAVLTGYRRALELGAEILVKMDADGQMDPAHLLRLISPIVLGTADYTKGNRFLHEVELRSMPGKRRFGNATLSFLTKLASGYWAVYDPTNGYTAIHSSLVPMLPAERIARRFFFESSMLLNLSLLRAVVLDVYIPARYPAVVSSLSESRSALEFPWPLVRGLVRRLRVQYFVRDFTAVSLYVVFGLLLTVFGVTWGGWRWILSSTLGTPATTGSVMLAVLPVILGVQLLLQAVALDIQNVPTIPIHTTVSLLRGSDDPT